MLHFLQVADQVLSQIDFLNFVTVGEIAQLDDFVERQRHNLKVWHFPQQVEIVDLVAPEVDVLDKGQVVRLAFCRDHLSCERLGGLILVA